MLGSVEEVDEFPGRHPLALRTTEQAIGATTRDKQDSENQVGQKLRMVAAM
jgi:hypothetical protein